MVVNTIEDLVSELRFKLGDYLSERGIDNFAKEFQCLHPDHKDSHPSMKISPSGTFVKCFSCNAAADIFTVANWLEDKPISGPEWVTENVFYLAKKYNIDHDLTTKNGFNESSFKYTYFRAHRIAAEYLQNVAESKDVPESYEKELKKRKWGKSKESARLGVGCVRSYNEFVSVLDKHGFDEEVIKRVGLNRSDIFNPDSVIFTICDEHNRPIAFYSRDTKYEEKRAAYDKQIAETSKLEITKPVVPSKYNSSANLTGIYEKQLCPYGLNDIKSFHEIYLVEGHSCKHSLKLQGEKNVIALGGLEFSEHTIERLSNLGVTNLILLLDNDSKGRAKIKSIIRKYYSKISVELSVLDIGIYPDIKDPDELIRKYGIEAFRAISKKNALEWLVIDEIDEKGDAYTVLQDIVPLIALDKSPINRLKLINVLAEITKISREIIQEEVDQKISISKDRRGEYALKVLREAQDIIINNPSAVDAARSIIELKLANLDKSSTNDELFSSAECLRGLVKMQQREDSGEQSPVVLTGYDDWDELIPMPTSEAFVLIMGPPNTGKSSIILNKALREIDANENHMSIILTIDDSREVYMRRMVASLAKLPINWISNPKYFLDAGKQKARLDAYTLLGEHMRSDKLVIKDVSHGNTAEYCGRLISHYREKWPGRTIVFYCDNLHKLDSEAGHDDSRVKTKSISALMKSYTTKYNITNICTVEMTKDGMYEKPTDARTISEAAGLQFDANLIIYLWNEINTKREAADLVFEGTELSYFPESGYVHKPVIKPIIEALILKNKLSAYKGSLYFRFHPELAIYDDFPIAEAKRLLAKIATDKTAKQAERKAAKTNVPQ